MGKCMWCGNRVKVPLFCNSWLYVDGELTEGPLLQYHNGCADRMISDVRKRRLDRLADKERTG